MKSLIFSLSIALFSFSASAADLTCSCEDNSCKPIEVNFVASNPGVYLSISLDEGKKVYEGYATITRSPETGDLYYRFANFTFAKKQGEWSMPLATDRVCK